MTNTEFSNEFDIRLNQRVKVDNYIQLNEYEKSVLLTDSQEAIVKSLLPEYDTSEYSRTILSPITKTYKTTSIETSSDNFITYNDNFKSFSVERPSDMWGIATEQIISNNKGISVEPIRYDEFNNVIENPFRNPNKKRIWRLLYNDITNRIEFISIKDLPNDVIYFNRYIQRPKPIILDGATLSIDDEDLSIRGLNSSTTELSTIIHEDILNNAINLAIQTLNLQPK